MPSAICWQTGVYVWTNLINGKVYVGGAYVAFKARFREYKYRLPHGRCHNRHLQAAWNKYGAENFKLEVVERCPPEMVEERETHWINTLDAANPERGYNTCPTGRSRLGVKHTEESKRQMSVTKKSRVYVRKPRRHTEETKAKMSANRKGKKPKLSEETRRRLSEFRRGRKRTEEECQAMKDNHWSKGPRAAEIAAKIGAGYKGLVNSPEAIAKMAATKTGVPLSPESIAKRELTRKWKRCRSRFGKERADELFGYRDEPEGTVVLDLVSVRPVIERLA